MGFVRLRQQKGCPGATVRSRHPAATIGSTGPSSGSMPACGRASGGQGRAVMLSSLVSSHTRRRTYATNMFRAGGPTMLVMAATGHQTERAFLRYVRAGGEEMSRMQADWVRKLGL